MIISEEEYRPWYNGITGYCEDIEDGMARLEAYWYIWGYANGCWEVGYGEPYFDDEKRYHEAWEKGLRDGAADRKADRGIDRE